MLPPAENKLQIVGTLKLLMILTIVLSHSRPSVSQLDPTQWGAVICKIFAGTIAFNFGVPGFFLVSGYLFFRGVSKLSKTTYADKLRRRIRTLLIPYIIWNIFCCGLFLFKVYFLNGPALGIVNAAGSIDLPAFLEGFIAIPCAKYMPYAFAFWFIRNLMVVVVLSPLALVIGRRLWAVALMLVVIVAFGNELYGFDFFTLGAAAAIHNLNPSSLKLKQRYVICAAVVAFALEYGMQFVVAHQPYVFLHYTVFALLFIVAINIALRVNCHSLLVDSTFFIYAFHQCFITVSAKFWARLIGVSTSAGAVAYLLLEFTTLFGVSWIVWFALRSICPRFLAVITGGRS